jgi:hypothetical protein
VSDEYTYCISDHGTMACISSTQPLSDAEVRSQVSITPENGYNEIYTQPVPQDQPWYLDAFDAVTRWITNLSADQIGLGVVGTIAVILLVMHVRRSDMAPDAYDAEDYIEDLNDEAYDRMYADTDDESTYY